MKNLINAFVYIYMSYIYILRKKYNFNPVTYVGSIFVL